VDGTDSESIIQNLRTLGGMRLPNHSMAGAFRSSKRDVRVRTLDKGKPVAQPEYKGTRRRHSFCCTLRRNIAHTNTGFGVKCGRSRHPSQLVIKPTFSLEAMRCEINRQVWLESAPSPTYGTGYMRSTSRAHAVASSSRRSPK
jgi:hypothetical protein